MDFDLSDDQVALQDAARGLLAEKCDRERVRAALESDGYDEAVWAAMVDQGWIGVALPSERGGLGLGPVEAAVLLEQAGAHLAPVPLGQQLLTISFLADTNWLSALLSGELIGTAARTPITMNGDGTVTGRPEPVLFGASAAVLVIPAIAADGETSLVAVDLAEVERRPEPAMDLTRELAWVDLEGVPATVIGDEVAATRLLDHAATFHAAEMLGGAETVMNLAVAYAKEREQFGRPIGSFQAVKHRCADMLVDVEGMRSAAYYAAWTIGAEGRVPGESSVAASTAKVWNSDAAVRVAESALQVHGGIGFTWEADVHLYLKRAQLDQVSYGDAAFHRARLHGLLRARLADGHSVI